MVHSYSSYLICIMGPSYHYMIRLGCCLFWAMVCFHYVKNPILQQKFCNRPTCCKTVTGLQWNENENVLSINCNGLAIKICKIFISIAKHGGKLTALRRIWLLQNCNEIVLLQTCNGLTTKLELLQFRSRLATFYNEFISF